MADQSSSLVFSDNSLLPSLFGEQDTHLLRIEEKLNVSAHSRGNQLSLHGKLEDVDRARHVLETLYELLKEGTHITMKDVDAAIRMSPTSHDNEDTPNAPTKGNRLKPCGNRIIKTLKKHIRPYSKNQNAYIESLFNHELVLASGPAGTGKTYLAVAAAVSMFLEHKVERIILSRPAVEAGEKLGFLPGDMKEKVDPYLSPLYDALYDMLPAERVIKHIENGEIEIAPLAFMRGRTLNSAFIILDEAQNSTPTQMKMFLTRLGEGARMAVCGDLSQTDLSRDIKSGLRDALEKLKHIEEVGFVRFSDEDIVRHPLTARIVQAYEDAKDTFKATKT